MVKDVWSCILNKSFFCELNVVVWIIWIYVLLVRGYVKEVCLYCLEMMDMDLMLQFDIYVKFMKGLNKLYNRMIVGEIIEKVMKMVSEREMSFKMYKRRGEEDLIEKVKFKGNKEGKKKGIGDCNQYKWGGE